MLKFLRNYSLSIQTNAPGEPQFITVSHPLTIEFDIKRDVYGGANEFFIRIYNLSEQKRNQILHDYWSFNLNRLVILRAGYGQNPNTLPVILKGRIAQAWSIRRGVDFITEIQGQDGAGAYAEAVLINQQFPSGSSNQFIIETIAKTMSVSPFNIGLGAIGTYSGSITRGACYNGSTLDTLSELTGNGTFIDNETVNCLNDNEYIGSGNLVTTINSKTGLLGTPKRELTLLYFDIVFEPQIKPGHSITLQSITGSNYNGPSKVFSVQHKGIISNAICGDAITTVAVNYGPNNLVPVSVPIQ